MIIFLYGKDDFRSLEKLKQIITAYQKIHQTGLNLKFFDFQKNSFEDFQDAFQTKPMFKEKKLFVLKNSFSCSHLEERVLKNKKSFLQYPHLMVFYEKEELPKKHPLFVFLKKNSRYQKFDLLSKEQLENWITKELKKYQMAIEPLAKKILIKYLGNDLWRLSSEIKKIVSYKGKTKKISKKDVEIMVKPELETNIFQTIDYLASQKKERALALLHQHLEKGESAFYLLSMIAFQFRNLLMLKARHQFANNTATQINQISKELGMHHFVVRKSLPLCQKFTLEQLKKIYQKIFETDIAIKTGKIDPSLALDLLVAKI